MYKLKNIVVEKGSVNLQRKKNPDEVYKITPIKAHIGFSIPTGLKNYIAPNGLVSALTQCGEGAFKGGVNLLCSTEHFYAAYFAFDGAPFVGIYSNADVTNSAPMLIFTSAAEPITTTNWQDIHFEAPVGSYQVDVNFHTFVEGWVNSFGYASQSAMFSDNPNLAFFQDYYAALEEYRQSHSDYDYNGNQYTKKGVIFFLELLEGIYFGGKLVYQAIQLNKPSILLFAHKDGVKDNTSKFYRDPQNLVEDKTIKENVTLLRLVNDFNYIFTDMEQFVIPPQKIYLDQPFDGVVVLQK